MFQHVFLYMSIKNKRIPMGLNVDLNKINKQQQEIQTVTPVEVKSTSASVNVPIGKTETANTDLCSKLGITQEQYVKLCTENPQFLTLSFEEQLKFIKNIKQSVDTSAATDETTDTSAGSDVAAEASTNNGSDEKTITKSRFSKMSLRKKFDVYSTELAKNQFLYGDADNKKTIEDWNNLSKEEQQKLIEQQKTILSKKQGVLNKRNAKAWLDTSMTELYAATKIAELSLADFKKIPRGQQEEYIYDYLFEQDEKDLSITDLIRLRETELLCASAQYISGSDMKPCPAKAREILDSQKVSSVEAEYEYLKNKLENPQGEEKLTKYEHIRLTSLEKFLKSDLSEEVKENFGTRSGDTPTFWTEINNSEYGEALKNASEADKVLIIKQYLEKTYDKNDPKYPQIIEDFTRDAIQCGNIELAEYLHELANLDSKIAKKLANSDKKEINLLNGVRYSDLGSHGKDFINRMKSRKDGEKYITSAQKGADESQMIDLAKATNGVEWQSVHDGNVYMSHRAEKSEIQKELANVIRANNNQKAIELAAATADKYNDDVEKDALATLTYENEGATHAAIESNVYSRMAVENQKDAYKMMLARNEEYTTDAKVAEQYSMKMADQVETLDASVQAEAHRIISGSKFDSVVEHAAENIYKYDESAQKDAMKYTLETGNEKAIEAAISNADRCEGLKNETSAAPSNSESYDSQLAKEIKTYTTQIEQKYTNQVAQSYSEYTAEQDLRTGLIDETETKSAVEAYIEKFKDPTTNKFALIGQLEPSQKKAAIKALVKYAPTLINSFIDMGYGPEILKIIGETSDLAIKVVQLMDYKGQSEVKEIVRKHPEHYEELYVKYFMDDKPSLAQNQYMTSPYGDNSMLKRMTKEGQIYFNI